MLPRSLLSLILLSGVVSAQIFSLGGLDWTLKNANGSVIIPASVPSQVHLDLANAGIITEPLLGANGMVNDPKPEFHLFFDQISLRDGSSMTIGLIQLILPHLRPLCPIARFPKLYLSFMVSTLWQIL